MINLKKYKNIIYLIVIFSLIIFTFSFISSIIITDYKNMKEVNSFINNNTKTFKFEEPGKDSQKIQFTKLINILEKYNSSNIYLESDPIPKYLSETTLFGKAIYFNYDNNMNLPIIEGSEITLDEVKSKEKVVVVGKNLKENIIIENNEKYFTIDDIKYKVIGILGDNKEKTPYDDTFLVNMNSMDYKTDYRSTFSLNVSSTKDLESILVSYQQLSKDNLLALKFVENKKSENKINLKDILENYDYEQYIYILKIVCALGMLNLIIVVYFWINTSIKEIGIRKAYGATDFQISKYILKKYMGSVMISLIVGISLHIILKGILITMFPKLSFDLYLENILLSTIIFTLIGLIVTIIPLIKAKKIPPIFIMKGKL